MVFGINCYYLEFQVNLYVSYKSVKTCIKANGSLTEYFDSYMGVKQGEPLSPLLFKLFINDMSEYLKDETVEVVNLEELQIFCYYLQMILFYFPTLLRATNIIK